MAIKDEHMTTIKLDGLKPLPQRIVRQAINTVAPCFASRRMVKEYAEQMYSPAIRGSGYKFVSEDGRQD